MKKVLFRTLLFMLLANGAFTPIRAQEEIVQVAELASESFSESEINDITARLEQLEKNPIEINTADFQELRQLPMLSDSQIDNILQFRDRHGHFMYKEELLMVYGIGERTFRSLLPFISVHISTDTREKRRGNRHELLVKSALNHPFQLGYADLQPSYFADSLDFVTWDNRRYLGPPFSLMAKYKGNVGDLSFGITAEKDSGEPFKRSLRIGQKEIPLYAADFHSGYVQYAPGGLLEKLIVGDFRVRWGEGLVLWNGFSMGKSVAATNLEKGNGGLSSYSSTDEVNFFRGVAATLTPVQNRLSTDLFFSRKRGDGTLTLSAEEDADRLAASLYETGYHRSRNEAAKRNQTVEIATGAAVRLNHDLFFLSAYALFYNFNPPISLGNRLYQQHNDNGKNRLFGAVNYKTGFGAWSLFGEVALANIPTKNGITVATLHALRYSGEKIGAALLYRRYDHRYVSYYSSGFGEYSGNRNEEGLYLGMEWNPGKNIKINGYFDLFHFFAPRYQASFAFRGWETQVQLTCSSPAEKPMLHTIETRFKAEIKPEDITGDGVLTTPIRTKTDWRLHYTIGRRESAFNFRVRYSGCYYEKDTIREWGTHLYAEVAFQPKETNLTLYFRGSGFFTGSYHSRIYAYEHAPLYTFTSPASYGKGMRIAMNLTFKPKAKTKRQPLTLYYKSGYTHYFDRESTGSGLSATPKPYLFDHILQMRLVL